MSKSVKQYLGIDAYNRKEDGTIMTHNEKYETIVNDIGLRQFVPLMPVGRKQMEEAYIEDDYLNTIPLSKWDAKAHTARQMMANIGITSTSLVEGVCLVKAAARLWVKG